MDTMAYGIRDCEEFFTSDHMNGRDGVVVSPIGRVVATERRPNIRDEFHFWTALDATVGIGTIVRVVGAHPVGGQLPTVYGVVVEGYSYTDLQSPLHDVLGHDGSPARAAFAATERTEIRRLHRRPCCAMCRRNRFSRCRWGGGLPRR